MVRRHQQAKRQERRAERDRQHPDSMARGEYEPPDRAICVEKTVHLPWGDGFEFRIELRFWRHEHETTEFVYLIQRRVWDDWTNVARIDCSHGSCHVHDPDDGPPTEELVRLDTTDDVRASMALAQDKAREILEDLVGGEST